MVFAGTIKLQSPAFNNAGAGAARGEELLLPGVAYTLGGNSLAAILTLFSGVNEILDFGQLKEVIRVVGTLTDATATASRFTSGGPPGTYVTVANAVEFRDRVRGIRLQTGGNWPFEDGTLAGAQWNTGTLPAEEQEAEARALGKARLILDKKWDRASASLKPLMMYGTVADFTFPNVRSPVARTAIPFGVTFFVGTVNIQ